MTSLFGPRVHGEGNKLPKEQDHAPLAGQAQALEEHVHVVEGDPVAAEHVLQQPGGAEQGHAEPPALAGFHEVQLQLRVA